MTRSLAVFSTQLLGIRWGRDNTFNLEHLLNLVGERNIQNCSLAGISLPLQPDEDPATFYI